MVPGQGLGDRDASDDGGGQREHHQRAPEEQRRVVHGRLGDRRVREVDHRELLGLRRERANSDQVLDRGVQLGEALLASRQPDEEARADERLRMRLQGGSARERRWDGGEPARQPHGADDLELGHRTVDVASLRHQAVEVEVIRLAQELHREPGSERHVELPLEVLSQHDLDDVGIRGRLGQATVQHDRIDDR